MEGWPLLETAERFDADMKPPVIQDDGTILTFETTALEEDGDLVAADKPQVDGAIKTFRREAGRLVLVSESVSDEERERRRQRDEAEAARKAWRAELEATDPLYLAFAKRLEDPWLTPDDWTGVGVTHDKWCPFFSVREPRWWRRIAQSRGGRRYTLDLEWAIETGPVKLVIYDGGRHVEDEFYPHSVDGMNAAFDHAKSLLCSGASSGADGPA